MLDVFLRSSLHVPGHLFFYLWCCNVCLATSSSSLRLDVKTSKREKCHSCLVCFVFFLIMWMQSQKMLSLCQVVFGFWLTEVLSAKGICVSEIS